MLKDIGDLCKELIHNSGKVGEICEGEECKVEVRCKMEYVKDAVEVIRRIHPYEEPLFNIIPIINDLFE